MHRGQNKVGFMCMRRERQGKPHSVCEIKLARLPRNRFHFLLCRFMDLSMLPYMFITPSTGPLIYFFYYVGNKPALALM